MQEYDHQHYFPERKKLREACAALGHPGTRNITDNGLGWAFENCRLCGGVVKKYGPEGEINGQV